MEFADIDIHKLPAKGVKKVSEEKEKEPAIYKNQAYLAKVIIERFAHLIEKNEHCEYKLLPLLEQANGTKQLGDDEKVYTGFQFMIYTAISNMLEHRQQ